jgi:hypothetical protein
MTALTTGEHEQHAYGSYIFRHWRGELSLPVSYWINNVLLEVVYFLLLVGGFFAFMALHGRQLSLLVFFILTTLALTYPMTTICQSKRSCFKGGHSRAHSRPPGIICVVVAMWLPFPAISRD